LILVKARSSLVLSTQNYVRRATYVTRRTGYEAGLATRALLPTGKSSCALGRFTVTAYVDGISQISG